MQKRRTWITDGRPRGMQHESYAEYKRAKFNFRSTQQKAIYEFENQQLINIDESSEHDIRLFWRLINAKNGKRSNHCFELNYNEYKAETPQNIANTFASYFKDLYSFNDDEDVLAEDPLLQQDLLTLPKVISIDDIFKQLKKLKKRKAPGIDKIQNEHLIYGGRTLHQCLSNLFSAMLKYSYVPLAWKIGITIPIYKGGNKAKTNPDSYRAISLLPSMYKLFEKVIHENILNALSKRNQKFPSVQQQGYQKQLGSETVAFNLHEAIYSTLEQSDTAYVAFLDTHKAFDTVWHKGMLHKLKLLGIDPQYLNLISNAYHNIQSIVSINTYQSAPFNIKRGIRQGGVLSSLLYIIFINDLVEELDKSNLGVSICDIKASNPTLVDDLTLVSRSPLHLQLMINISVDHSKRCKFGFSTSKCSVMVITLNQRSINHNFVWTIDNQILKQSNTSTHVGIPITNDMKCHEKVQNACRKGRAAFHRLLDLSSAAESPRLNPLTLTKLYKSIVIPSTLYGCETWSRLTAHDLNELEKFQHFCVKKIQCLPWLTRSYMCESLLGLPKLSSEIDKRKLFFLERLIRLPETTLTKQIFIRRLFSFQYITDRSPLGFIPDVIKIMEKYNILEHLHSYLANYTFPNTAVWKKIVKHVIYENQSKSYKQVIQEDPDFARFKYIQGDIIPSIIWQAASTPAELKLMHFVAKCAVLPPKSTIETCRNCMLEFSDPIYHIVTSCLSTLDVRTTFWDYPVDTLSPNCSVHLSSLDNEQFLHILLGKRLSIIEDEFQDKKDYFTFIKICANFVYTAVNIYYNCS